MLIDRKLLQENFVMNNVDFNVDTTEMQKMNRWFSQKDWWRIKKKALNKAAGTIKKTVKQKFRTLLPMATVKNPLYNDKLIDAIRSSKVKDKGIGELIVKVHTLGTRKKGSGTFRARFFEGGTQERFIKPGIKDSLGRTYKKKRSIGRIHPPLYFFRDSMSSINSASVNMNSYLEQEINRINQKKF